MSGHATPAANSSWRANDGPAVEWSDDTTAWYRNGRFHREDGSMPARTAKDEERWAAFLRRQKCARLRDALRDKPLTDAQRELLYALSENWEGTPDLLYETALSLSEPLI